MSGEFKNKISRWILPVLALIGILISVELTVIYYNANFVSESSPSFCAINKVINCDDVARTQYSTFLGLPVSIYGLFYYFIVLLLSISKYSGNFFSKYTKNPESYIFSLSSISIIISIFMAWISAFQIHKICILCYITYFLNILIFTVSKSRGGYMQHYKNTIQDSINVLSKPVYIIFTLITLIIISGSLYYFNTSKIFIPKDRDYLALRNYLFPEFNYNDQGNTIGAKNPKLVINEYTDFECPYCAILNLMMHKLVAEEPEVQVIHHDFPLGGGCNPLVNNPEHKTSCLAALYSRAAEKQGKMPAFDDLLFENWNNLTEARMLDIAKALNLDIKKLKQDAYDFNAKKQLREDIKNSIKQGINATPTYFIGSKKQVGLLPYPKLKQIVTANLK